MSPNPTISVRSEINAANLTLAATDYTAAVASGFSDLFRVRKSGRYHSFQYVDTAQAQAALVRGLRVYYEVKSPR
jgi:hypothetical protein